MGASVRYSNWPSRLACLLPRAAPALASGELTRSLVETVHLTNVS